MFKALGLELKDLATAKGCLIFQMPFKICQKCETDNFSEKMQIAQEGFI